MNVVLTDIDPRAYQVEGRDTEHEGAGNHEPQAWSDPQPLVDVLARIMPNTLPPEGQPEAIMLLGAAAAVGNGPWAVTISTDVNAEDGHGGIIRIRTTDMRISLAPSKPAAPETYCPSCGAKVEVWGHDDTCPRRPGGPKYPESGSS